MIAVGTDILNFERVEDVVERPTAIVRDERAAHGQPDRIEQERAEKREEESEQV